MDRPCARRNVVQIARNNPNYHTWSAPEVVEAYGRQQHVERVFRGLKGGGWLGWGAACQCTDGKLQVHGFCGVLGCRCCSTCTGGRQWSGWVCRWNGRARNSSRCSRSTCCTRASASAPLRQYTSYAHRAGGDASLWANEQPEVQA